MSQIHPKKNDQGQAVMIRHPSEPTDFSAWANPARIATVVPAHPMPEAVGGISVGVWMDVPRDLAGWERLAESSTFDDPPFIVAPGTSPASGAVVVESDGRVWVVSPTNRFAGYTNTFPKGTIESGQRISLRANALKEVFEEAGLHVELTGFLADSVRSTTTTRYYLALRIGGDPADMEWESQAVHLVPRDQLASFVSHKNDQVTIQALMTKIAE